MSKADKCSSYTGLDLVFLLAQGNFSLGDTFECLNFKGRHLILEVVEQNGAYTFKSDQRYYDDMEWVGWNSHTLNYIDFRKVTNKFRYKFSEDLKRVAFINNSDWASYLNYTEGDTTIFAGTADEGTSPSQAKTRVWFTDAEYEVLPDPYKIKHLFRKETSYEN